MISETIRPIFIMFLLAVALLLVFSQAAGEQSSPVGASCAVDEEVHTSLHLLQVDLNVKSRKLEKGDLAHERESARELVHGASGMIDGERSILETCPVERFNASLAWLVSGRFLQESNSTSLALSRYLEIAEQHRCARPGPRWTVSDKKMIINVGEGTTGTRTLSGLMQNLSYNTCHWCQQWLQNGTLDPEEIDSYDMISDTPVAFLTWELLQSYPQALFIMTVRDPVDWRASRLSHHRPEFQGVPCGRSNQTIVSEDALQTYVAYSAWAKCVLPADRLLVTNFFTNDQSDSEFFDMLIDFLQLHGMQRPGWDTLVADARDAYLNHAHDSAN